MNRKVVLIGRTAIAIAALVIVAFLIGSLAPWAGGRAAAPDRQPVAALQQATSQAAATLVPVVTAPGDQTLIALYKKVAPSVVTVYIRIPEDALGAPTQPPLSIPTPFAPTQEPFSVGNGSGFIYSDEGYIITNAHVVLDVGNTGRIRVTFADDFTVPATVVGIDPDSDMAVLKVQTNKARLVPLKLADSDQLQVGQRVAAFGNPFRYYPGTMTQGIVSAVNRRFDSQAANYQIPGMIQTDTAINPGNSGGPLVDMEGNVVGINTAIESRVRQSSGVGFAVPSNLLAKFAPRLIKDGKVTHAYLGIRGSDLDTEINDLDGLSPEQQGILVSSITRNSPAERAGVRGATDKKYLDGQEIATGGDVIIAINGLPLRKFEQLLGYLFTKTEPGDTVTLTLLRDGKTQDLQVTLVERPYTSN